MTPEHNWQEGATKPVDLDARLTDEQLDELDSTPFCNTTVSQWAKVITELRKLRSESAALEAQLAEKDKEIARLRSDENAWNKWGNIPNDILRKKLSANEAQLAQRDERIRKLAKAWDNWYDGPESMIDSDLIEAIIDLRDSLPADAKEGEGK